MEPRAPRLGPGCAGLALADLEQAIARGSAASREVADDYVEKGRLLLADQCYAQALVACDAARRINPSHAEMHRVRASALFEVGCFDEAIAACNDSLRAGGRSAELLGLRGLAKARHNDFAGAIDDYTGALAAQPASARLHAQRGWAYLFSGRPS